MALQGGCKGYGYITLKETGDRLQPVEKTFGGTINIDALVKSRFQVEP